MRIGIDLGGTKIAGAVMSSDGRILARRRCETPRVYEQTLRELSDMVRTLEHEVGYRCSVGLGVPGAKSPQTGLMKNAYNAGLNGHPFDDDLAKVLERPVRIANDADCFALSEAMDGAASDATVVFGVIVGTGTGGGVVVDKRLVAGVNAIAGEWGHNPLPWPHEEERPGPSCYCGRDGCIERFLSGPGLENDHERVTGVRLTGEEIMLGAERGDDRCMATRERYVDRMARALATIINVIDPGAIVLGGGVSRTAALYELVPTRWGEYVFSDEVSTKLVRHQHGDDSGLRGAAWLWPLDGGA